MIAGCISKCALQHNFLTLLDDDWAVSISYICPTATLNWLILCSWQVLVWSVLFPNAISHQIILDFMIQWWS